jgi:hypothetical protein
MAAGWAIKLRYGRSGQGAEDLIFLAICTPRFRPDNYEDIDPEPMQTDKEV